MVIIGLVTLLWMSLLLAISYFVLLTAEKAPEKLKSFGKFVGSVLIVVALVIAVSGIAMLVTGSSPIQCPMMSGGGMKCCMGGMQGMGGAQGMGKMGPMMKGGMNMPQPPQDDKSPVKCQ